MQTDVIATTTAPTPGGAYSQAIRAGQLVFLSGQVGIDPETRQVRAGVADQTRQHSGIWRRFCTPPEARSNSW